MQNAERRKQKIVLRVTLGLVICCALLSASAARGDGGRLQSSQRHGDLQLTVFTLPAAPSVGPLDVSVLVQDVASGKVREDANVTVELEQLNSPSNSSPIRFQQPASSAAATNKLFLSALFDLPTGGRWKAGVSVEDQPAASFELSVGEAPPPWLEIAPWVTWPLAVIALFVVHQLLLKRGHRRFPAVPAGS